MTQQMNVFGKEVQENKGFILKDCKVEYFRCPLSKTLVDDGCDGCINLRKEFFKGTVHRGTVLVEESCYQRMSGEKCLRGFEKFLNNDVCKKCVRFLRNIVGESKENELH